MVFTDENKVAIKGYPNLFPSIFWTVRTYKSCDRSCRKDISTPNKRRLWAEWAHPSGKRPNGQAIYRYCSQAIYITRLQACVDAKGGQFEHILLLIMPMPDQTDNNFLLCRGSGCEVLWWARLCTCLSVCLRGYLQNHTRDLCQIFVHAAYGSVLLWQNDEIPRARGSFGGFLPQWQCYVQYSIWDPYKNGWTDPDSVWDDEWTWPEEQCVTWGWRFPKG